MGGNLYFRVEERVQSEKRAGLSLRMSYLMAGWGRCSSKGDWKGAAIEMRGIGQYCLLESERSVFPEGRVVQFHQTVLRGKWGLKHVSEDSGLLVRVFPAGAGQLWRGNFRGNRRGFSIREKSLVRMLLAVVTLDKSRPPIIGTGGCARHVDKAPRCLQALCLVVYYNYY